MRRVGLALATAVAIAACTPFPDYLYHSGGHIDLGGRLLDGGGQRYVFVVQDPNGERFVAFGDAGAGAARVLIFDQALNLITTKDVADDLINTVAAQPLPRSTGGFRTAGFFYDANTKSVTDERVNLRSNSRWWTGAYGRGYYFIETKRTTAHNDTLVFRGYSDRLVKTGETLEVVAFSDNATVVEYSVNDLVVEKVPHVALHMRRRLDAEDRVYSILIRASRIADPSVTTPPPFLVNMNDVTAGSQPIVVTTTDATDSHVWTADGLIYLDRDRRMVRVDVATGARSTIAPGNNADAGRSFGVDPAGAFALLFDPRSKMLFRIDPWW